MAAKCLRLAESSRIFCILALAPDLSLFSGFYLMVINSGQFAEFQRKCDITSEKFWPLWILLWPTRTYLPNFICDRYTCSIYRRIRNLKATPTLRLVITGLFACFTWRVYFPQIAILKHRDYVFEIRRNTVCPPLGINSLSFRFYPVVMQIYKSYWHKFRLFSTQFSYLVVVYGTMSNQQNDL